MATKWNGISKESNCNVEAAEQETLMAAREMVAELDAGTAHSGKDNEIDDENGNRVLAAPFLSID
jgi:hypothetical protein